MARLIAISRNMTYKLYRKIKASLFLATTAGILAFAVPIEPRIVTEVAIDTAYITITVTGEPWTFHRLHTIPTAASEPCSSKVRPPPPAEPSASSVTPPPLPPPTSGTWMRCINSSKGVLLGWITQASSHAHWWPNETRPLALPLRIRGGGGGPPQKRCAG
ncbi:hypothetical protein V8F06_010899 [Rhypophila decipiens]